MHDDWAIGGALMMNGLPKASCEFWNSSPTRTFQGYASAKCSSAHEASLIETCNEA